MTDDRAERRKQFAKLVSMYDGLAPRGAIEIGFMLQDFLEHAVVDSGTSVDKGVGLGSFDLWATVNGREYYIEIKPSLNQLARDAA